MKIKLAAYATAAVLIGFAVMMLPLALETGPPTYDPRQAPSTYTSSASESESQQIDRLKNMWGLDKPTSYIISPPVLILLAGLAVALVAYAYIKSC